MQLVKPWSESVSMGANWVECKDHATGVDQARKNLTKDFNSKFVEKRMFFYIVSSRQMLSNWDREQANHLRAVLQYTGNFMQVKN